MKKTFYRIAIITALWVAVFSSCEKDKNSPQNTSPVITEKGTSVGNPASASIGASGGTLESYDGKLTVTIPAGALTSTTTLSVEPITNKAPLGVGTGYRLSPEGTTFNKPVKLTFHYNEELLNGVPSDFLWIVTQASDGSWAGARKSVVDTLNKTVTVDVPHFSDWALGKFIDFVLSPSSKTLLKGTSVTLKLTGFSRDKNITEEDDLVPLIPTSELDDDGLVPLPNIPAIEERLMDFRVKQWTLNGSAAPVSNSNGTLSPSGLTATYTAPNKRPANNPVAVTVQLESSNKEGKKASFYVTSTISVVESDLYLLVTINGSSYEYFQYGVNGTIPPDPNNYTGVNCNSDAEGLGIVAITTTNSTTFVNGFALALKNPVVGSQNLEGFNCDGDDDITFQIYPSTAYSLNYTQRTYDALHDICNTEYLCSNVSVTILEMDDKTAIVRGYFSGEVYSESSNSDHENCRTPAVHTISGEFRLIMINKYFGQ
jgi:hypothetical protein